MTLGRTEKEIKLELPAAAAPLLQGLPLIRRIGKKPQCKTEVSVYYDTPERDLRKRGLTLRVRYSDGCYVQTIKAASDGAIFARDEWEWELAGPRPDLRGAAATALKPLLSKKFCRRLRPLFETRVRRTLYPLVGEACTMALSLDRGSITTAKSTQPLCEVEVELQSGSEAELFAVAREIARAVPARLLMSSKAERGYQLADGADGAPVGFVAPVLEPGVSARAGFQRIGRACLQQIVGNEQAVFTGDAAGVHRMRVGIRRLRAAMTLCAELLGDPQSAAIKAELRWLGRELGPLRDFDVLMQEVVAPAANQRSGDRELAVLAEEVGQRREAAHARARDAVTSTRFRALAFDAAAWLETGEWTALRDARDRLSMRSLARRQLTRRWRRLRKRAKWFAKLDADARHKLRIQAKKLRYAAELFVDLFPGKHRRRRHKRFLDAIVQVQDRLGALNDIVVHGQLIGAMGAGRPTGGQCAAAAGPLREREDARAAAVTAAAAKALARFAKVAPFWR